MAIAAMQVIHMVRWWCGKYDYKLLCSNRFCQYSQPGDIKRVPQKEYVPFHSNYSNLRGCICTTAHLGFLSSGDVQCYDFMLRQQENKACVLHVYFQQSVASRECTNAGNHHGWI